jgi:hypothetical protein
MNMCLVPPAGSAGEFPPAAPSLREFSQSLKHNDTEEAQVMGNDVKGTDTGKASHLFIICSGGRSTYQTSRRSHPHTMPGDVCSSRRLRPCGPDDETVDPTAHYAFDEAKLLAIHNPQRRRRRTAYRYKHYPLTQLFCKVKCRI